MSLLTKEKIANFCIVAYNEHGITETSAKAMLLEALKMVEDYGLLADWEIENFVSDLANGVDITKSYTWPSKEAAFMLQCPEVYYRMQRATQVAEELKTLAASEVYLRAKKVPDAAPIVEAKA